MEFSDQKVAQQKKKNQQTKKQRRRTEQDRITQKTRQSNLVIFPMENRITQAQSQEEAIHLEDNQVSLKQVESEPKAAIQASPALFVVSDWDEFLENNW